MNVYSPFNKLIFRFPQYSINELDKALEDDDYFQEVIRSVSFREAIFFASPVLYEELIKYTTGNLKDKDKERVKNSLVRYLTRISSRCTPFGMFATCSIGKLDEETNIVLSEKIKAHIRLDMFYLCNLSQELAKVEEVKKIVKYHTNTTLFLKSKKIRYIEYKFNSDKKVYQLVEVDSNPQIRYIVEVAKKGIIFNELVVLFISKFAWIDEFSAISYIRTIIENQVLVSEIDPIVSGGDFFIHLMSIVQRLDHHSEIYKQMLSLQELLMQLNDEVSKKNRIDLCIEIEEVIKKINIPYNKKYLLQVDAIREMSVSTIGPSVIDSLQKCMDFLNKITVGGGEPQTLSEFKKVFRDRYEEREVPLLEVLDPDLGIGYPVNQINDISPLLNGLVLPAQSYGESFSSVVTPIHTVLQQKIMKFNPLTDSEIVIEDEDVKHLKASVWSDLPPTLFAKFQIKEAQSGNDEFSLVMNYFGGPSAANLLGRFAYCNDEIHDMINDIIKQETLSYPNEIIAEISHVPDSRIGNILARPSLRDYEILYLANTTRNREEIIYPSDIMLSIRNNQLILRSKKLDRKIIPRLTTAHNYHNNPTPIYRFLCELQTQNIRSSLFFNCDSFARQLDYLPRIRYRNIILSPAKYRVRIKNIDHLIKQKNVIKLKEEVQIWQESMKLPRKILLVDGDNTLLVDLCNINSIQAFLSILDKRNEILLEEYIPDSTSFIMDHSGNTYANECIVAFFNSEK